MRPFKHLSLLVAWLYQQDGLASRSRILFAALMLQKRSEIQPTLNMVRINFQ
jgi:hypothetical protein